MATEGNWGEGIIAYQWAEAGREILVQQTESIRAINLHDGGAVEQVILEIPYRDVLGFGYAAGDWWVAAKDGEKVIFRLGADSDPVLLRELDAHQVSLSLVSPDGRSVACVIEGSGFGIWSTRGGSKQGVIRIALEDEGRDIFGMPQVEQVSWSADSRFLAVQLGPPLDELLLVDGMRCRVVHAIY